MQPYGFLNKTKILGLRPFYTIYKIKTHCKTPLDLGVFQSIGFRYIGLRSNGLRSIGVYPCKLCANTNIFLMQDSVFLINCKCTQHLIKKKVFTFPVCIFPTIIIRFNRNVTNNALVAISVPARKFTMFYRIY